MFVAIPTAMPERAVDEQVRELGRQDRRLLLGPVVVVDEVDRVLVDVGEHLAGDRGQARLRVAHRGRRVAVDRAEVALAVDERVAHREVLGEADQRVVQRAVAVRVVLAHHLADDRRALAVRAGGRQAHLAHRVQDPAVDRLEAVAHVGQGARHDDAHRVVEVADPHLVLDADRSEIAQVVGHVLVSPVGSGTAGCVGMVIGAGARDGRRGRGAGRTGRRSRRRPRWPVRPDACGSPRGWSRNSSAVAGSSLASVSRMTQARWPSSVAAARSVSSRRAASVAGRSTTVSERYAHERAFWTSGSASPISGREQRQGVAGDLGIAAALAVDVGHRRDGRADEPALPARRAVDELLELGPAVGLRGDALAVRMGQRIDGDPVAGLAGGAAQQLPGPLGLGGEGPLEEAEGEPARLELALVEEAIGDEQERRGGRALRARCGSRAGRRRAAASERRGSAPIPGATRCWPARYSGSARSARPAVRAVAKPSGSLRELRQGRRRGPRPRHGARRRRRRLGGGLARGGRRLGRPAASPARSSSGGVHRSGRIGVGSWRPVRGSVGVALAEIALAGRVGGDVDAGRRGQLDRRSRRRRCGPRCRRSGVAPG